MIGVLGAYGDVGAHTVRMLAAHDLKLGGRWSGVDLFDTVSLDRFADGCRIVVNCAGPSHLIGDRVLRAAERAGAAYVDASGELTETSTTAVVGAGLQPGLTGLLPRWAVREARSLSVYLSVRDRFTETAAADYLHGTNEPLAAWRDGPVSRALIRRSGVTLPFLSEAVTLLPYLDDEACRVAKDLGLSRGEWYSAVSGEHVLRAFDRAHTSPDPIAALCQASRLDLAGREPHVVLAVEVDGVRTVLRGRSNGELTGTVVALAAVAVDRGDVPPGCHYAAEVLDPSVVDDLLDREEGVL